MDRRDFPACKRLKKQVKWKQQQNKKKKNEEWKKSNRTKKKKERQEVFLDESTI